MVHFSQKPLLFNSASLMKLRGQPKGHHGNMDKTNHSASGCNLVRTMRRGCLEAVSEPWLLREGGRQAEISLTDSSDNMKVGIIAQKLITPRVLQALDTLFSFICIH